MNILKKSQQRFNEVDFLKGLAIITMVTSHVFYFQYQLNMRSLNFNSPWYLFLTLFAQVVFITCIGLNLSLSNQSRQVNNYTPEEEERKKKSYTLKQLKRVLIIGCFALILSYLTYLTHGFKFIKFGILHFASLAILIMMWGVNSQISNAIIAILVVGLFFAKEPIANLLEGRTHPFLGFMTGLGHPSYYSMDYFPFVPWLGLVAIGIMTGNVAYKYYQRQFTINSGFEKFLNNNKNPVSFIIRECGKYSFLIYLLHIPILYFILRFIQGRKANTY